MNDIRSFNFLSCTEDKKLQNLQRDLISWKADQVVVPVGNAGGKVSTYSELSLLRHECGLKRPRTSIRKLIERAGKALLALKPCFMMGPISVSQYLTPGQFEFDMVIMDEASQIKPEDALGVIARGKQLIVVGDPKQLPPSNFFNSVVEDVDDDQTAIEESDSILDAATPIFNTRRLKWHYRSQHPSLISFSNHSFYNNDLILFPSTHSDRDTYGIKYDYLPDGCFVNQQNLVEANHISEAVRDHLTNNPSQSLGVVAMSSKQKSVIEGAIESLAKSDSHFQDILDKNEAADEPLFVKNLENVQGDERDVIFISFTYGPATPGGRVFQRFGPINSDVGWRRLNVLFTRSKQRMRVFTSMQDEDILATENSSRGVQALRGFLSFCRTGTILQTQETGREPDSDFEVAVISALDQAGFECVPQVGESGYYIDIAVRDPGKRSRYLMAIECDGATYHSAKSARDRDRLRQENLERLGWRVRRIWSTEWFKNPQETLKPIIDELNRLKSPVLEDHTPSEEPDQTIIDKEIPTEVKLGVIPSSVALDLRDKLALLGAQIASEMPATIESARLLRPAMIEALMNHLPTTNEEFVQSIPSYLRSATNSAEGKYLDKVFELINDD